MIESANESGPVAPRGGRLQRLGTVVVHELVELIVTGEVQPGAPLPPEGPLAEQFGVSRTVIRESVKRLEEKGLVVVAQGRGTHVTPSTSWNMLDRVVLSVLIDQDTQTGVLDELTLVRAGLEAVMAGQVAAHHNKTQLTRLRTTLVTMRDSLSDRDTFFQADVVFHYALMEMSGNRLAQNIAKSLYRRALESPRYQGRVPDGAVQRTLDEHTTIVDAIAAGRVADAEKAMRDHIEIGWQRRKLSGGRPRRRTVSDAD